QTHQHVGSESPLGGFHRSADKLACENGDYRNLKASVPAGRIWVWRSRPELRAFPPSRRFAGGTPAVSRTTTSLPPTLRRPCEPTPQIGPTSPAGAKPEVSSRCPQVRHPPVNTWP